MNPIAEIRPSPIAGLWYNGNPTELARQIDIFLAEAVVTPVPGVIKGLVAPHAGHRYSGVTAAHAFKTVKGHHYDLVVVVSPLHGYHPASFFTTGHLKYATPLGEIPVGQAAVRYLTGLMEQANHPLTPLFNDDEHSLEIELPFLQCVLDGPFSLLPIMVRSRDWESVLRLGEALAEAAKEYATLLVASTDLSHFYTLDMANRLDKTLLHEIEKYSPEGILQVEEQGKGYACGGGALAAVMVAARLGGANTAKILHYSTSADQTGDTRSVVGYGSAVLFERQNG